MLYNFTSHKNNALLFSVCYIGVGTEGPGPPDFFVWGGPIWPWSPHFWKMPPHLWVKSIALFSEHRRRLLYSGTGENISRWLTRTLSSLTVRPIFSFHSLRIFNPNNHFGKRPLRHRCAHSAREPREFLPTTCSLHENFEILAICI